MFLRRKRINPRNDSYSQTSDPSESAQIEKNRKSRMVPQVTGDHINDIVWRGSKCLLKAYDHQVSAIK